MSPVDPTLPTLYLYQCDLEPLLWPAHVTRFEDMTIVQLNRTSLRAEVVFWAMEHLTDAERTVIRLGYGASIDLSKPPEDRFLEGRVCDGDPVPPSLSLPGPTMSRTA